MEKVEKFRLSDRLRAETLDLIFYKANVDHPELLRSGIGYNRDRDDLHPLF